MEKLFVSRLMTPARPRDAFDNRRAGCSNPGLRPIRVEANAKETETGGGMEFMRARSIFSAALPKESPLRAFTVDKGIPDSRVSEVDPEWDLSRVELKQEMPWFWYW